MTGMFAPRVPKLTRAVQALEPTELLIIRGRQLKALATLHPALAWALIEEMTTVLHMAHRALYARAVASARQRVAITLVDRSLAINGCLETGCRIDATQQELAVSTGTARKAWEAVGLED